MLTFSANKKTALFIFLIQFGSVCLCVQLQFKWFTFASKIFKWQFAMTFSAHKIRIKSHQMQSIPFILLLTVSNRKKEEITNGRLNWILHRTKEGTVNHHANPEQNQRNRKQSQENVKMKHRMKFIADFYYNSFAKCTKMLRTNKTHRRTHESHICYAKREFGQSDKTYKMGKCHSNKFAIREMTCSTAQFVLHSTLSID